MSIAPPAAVAAEFARAWYVVLAAAVGVGLGITGLPIYTTGQFIRPLGEAFGWSRSATAGGLSVVTICSVLMAPVIGALVERFGVRRVAMPAMVGFSIGYLSLTLHGGSIGLYYAGWVAVGVLGAGTSPIVWTRAVASWFERSRGLALGITLCGTGLVAVVGPGVVGAIIAALGWKAGFYALAAAPVVIGLPLVALLFRAREAAYGTAAGAPGAVPLGAEAGALLAAPGTEAAAAVVLPGMEAREVPVLPRMGARAVSAVAGMEAGAAPVLPGMEAGKALTSGRFWRLAVAFFLMSIVVGGMIVSLPAMLADRGVDLAQAAKALGYLGFAVIGGRLATGALVDRFPARVVAAITVMLPAVACWLLAEGMHAVPAIVMIGLSTGAEVDLLAYLISRYFGMRHYARIYGVGLSVFSAGVGIGPLLGGWVHDRAGSYAPALYGFAAMSVIAGVLIGSLGRPSEVYAYRARAQ